MREDELHATSGFSEGGEGDPGRLDARLAVRLAALRLERGWSLDVLADRSGISRATLSRLERGDTSPTASLLGRLCTAYGRTMSRLLAEVEDVPSRVLRRDDQPSWTDPESGFRRRAVSPPTPGYNVEIVAGELPAGAAVSYDAPPVAGLEHHVVVLEGRLHLTLGDDVSDLGPGDCLRYHLTGFSRLACPGPEPARYLIAICHP